MFNASMMSNFPHRCATALLSAGLALLIAGASRADPSAFYLHNGDRVVTYGDSITAQQLYTVDLEAYIQTRYPKLAVSWINSGWGGDTVNGGAGGDIETRISRDIVPYQPTVMTLMLGMNDGGYHPFEQERFDTYSKGYQHILDEVSKRVPGVRYTLIKPSPWDDVTYPPGYFFVSAPGGYNDTLVRYGEEVGRIATERKTNLVDLNSTMNGMLAKAKNIDPQLAPKIIDGRVHPSPGGHAFMAYEIAKIWGMKPLVSLVAIDATLGKVTEAANAKVTGISTQGAITWTSLESVLPLPLDIKDNVTALVLKSSDIVADLDQETLKVTNLTAAKYHLKIDTTDIGDFSNFDLAAGINLATLDTPMLKQSMQVLKLAHEHADIHMEVLHNMQATIGRYDIPKVDKAVSKAIEDMEKANHDTFAAERAASTTTSHLFTLTPAL